MYGPQDGRATGTYLCENIPKSSKFPLACDFTAISWSVDSTSDLANGSYAPHMILSTL